MQPSNPVEMLYNDHHHWLTGWLRRKLGCPESAADLAQADMPGGLNVAHYKC